MNWKNNYTEKPEKQILAQDVMTSPPIAVKEDTCLPMVALLMKENQIGSVVVTDREEMPLGIVTRKDLVTRILAKITDKGLIKRILGEDANIAKLTAGEIMTSPLLVITPKLDLMKVARKMRRHCIRRLGVTSKGKLVGIISSKDILAVVPGLIEILQEKKKIQGVSQMDGSEDFRTAGYCEQCDNWSDGLIAHDGSFLCEECTA